MTEIQWIAVAALAGGLTWLIRAAPFVLAGWREITGPLKDFLVYTSLAIIAGIISKAMLSLQAGEGVETVGIKLACLLAALGLFRWSGNVVFAVFSAVGLAAALKMAIG